MRLYSTAITTIFCASLSLPLVAFAQPASPQPSAADRDTARKLLDDGDDAFAKKDYAGALKAFEAAHAIMHVPSTGFELAKAQAALGLLVEARDTALEVTRMPQAPQEPAAFADARKQAGALAAELDGRIPSLEVKPMGPPPGAQIEVRIDGLPIPAATSTLPRRVNPGPHKVSVSARGFEEASTDVTVAEADKLAVPITLVASAKPIAPVATVPPSGSDAVVPPPKGEVTSGSSMSVLLPVGIAATGGGLIVGLGTGLAALGNKGCKANHNCGLAWASDVGFGVAVVGAVLTTVGIVLTVKHPKSNPAHTAIRIDPVIGAGFLGARGEY